MSTPQVGGGMALSSKEVSFICMWSFVCMWCGSDWASYCLGLGLRSFVCGVAQLPQIVWIDGLAFRFSLFPKPRQQIRMVLFGFSV